MEKMLFSAYDMALLYNCRLLKKSIEFLINVNFAGLGNFVKKYLIDSVIFAAEIGEVRFSGYDGFYDVCNRAGIFNVSNGFSVKIGFWPELLLSDNMYKKGPIENYLFGICVEKRFINDQALVNIDFCEINGLIYLPVENFLFDHDGFSENPCSGISVSGELNLDVCHSVLCVYKFQNMIISAGDKIIEKLNNTFNGWASFSLGEPFIYNGIKCGDFINFNSSTNCLYFGLSPNVFDENLVGPGNVIMGDFFSSVAIIKDFVKIDSASELILNGAEFSNNWIYFPVCRKLLCVDNFCDLYVNRVVKIFAEGLVPDSSR